MRVRAARGAIVVDRDEPEILFDATERLLASVLERNEIEQEDLISVLFTVTDDLRSAFPAEAARRMGLGRVPLMCAREIPVEGSMPSRDPAPGPLPLGADPRPGGARLPRRRGVATR